MKEILLTIFSIIMGIYVGYNITYFIIKTVNNNFIKIKKLNKEIIKLFLPNEKNINYEKNLKDIMDSIYISKKIFNPNKLDNYKRCLLVTTGMRTLELYLPNKFINLFTIFSSVDIIHTESVFTSEYKDFSISIFNFKDYMKLYIKLELLITQDKLNEIKRAEEKLKEM